MTTAEKERQRMTALSGANEIRYAQTAIYRQLRSQPNKRTAEQHAADLLENPDETTGSIKLERFLRNIHRYGDRNVKLLLRELGLARTTRRIRELTERERGLLVAALREKGRA